MAQSLPDGYLEQFLTQIQALHQDHFVCLYQYGSDLHSMVLILKAADSKTLDQQAILQKSFQKPAMTYHILTLDEIEQAKDVFPMEFLEMKETRVLMGGTDVLEDLELNLTHLRHECEYVLRSNIMKLREGYIQPKRNINALIRSSFPSFMVAFKAFHRCQNQPVPKSKLEVITSLQSSLTFDRNVFEQIMNSAPDADISVLFPEYIAQLTLIVTQIDAF